MLLGSLAAGRLPTLILAVVLPWLLLAATRCRESWSWSGITSLLAAIALACAPVLIPAAVVLWLIGFAGRGRGIARHVATVIAPLVLKQAFVRAYEQHQAIIRRLSSPTNTQSFRWEAVYATYEQLQAVTDNARRCDACADWLSAYPASYADRQRETRELAAADRYEAAEQAFAYREENRLAAKDAFVNYRKAADEGNFYLRGFNYLFIMRKPAS